MASLLFFPALWCWTMSASCGSHPQFVAHLHQQEAVKPALLLGTRLWFWRSNRTESAKHDDWKAVQVEGKAPSGRTYHSAVAVDDNKIVYCGGNGSSNAQATTTLLHDGCIFIFGGWDPQRDDPNTPTSVFNYSFIHSRWALGW
uniref:RxLR effector candidate protein n=1 Tax=Hyaloperonospora arabidopsidis (strain Emoy2) TaxID=559515 RepID=M4B5P8_HYAAE